MATFTVSLSQELKAKIEEHPEINWSEYLKKRFEMRISELDKIKKFRNSQ